MRLSVDEFEEIADAGLLLVAERHRGGVEAVRQGDGWAAVREREGS